MQLTPATIRTLERCLTLPSTAELLNKSENQTRKLAQKAIKDERLSSRASGVWRGWLGMNGEVIVRESATPPADAPPAAASSFLPDEPPIAAPAETPSAGAAQVFDVHPEPSPLTKESPAVLERLKSLPDGSTYAEIVQLYRSGRTMKDSHAALRRFVISHAAELPAYIVKLVAPKAVVKVTDLTYTQIVERLVKQDEKLERLASLVQVLGMEMDMLTEEDTEEPEPPFSLRELLWPAVGAWNLTRQAGRRIIAVARRVPRAIGRFVDIVRGKES